MRRATFLVRGVVQGVGFRPYVYRLATDHHLVGSVCNTSTQVVIDAQGDDAALDRFARRLPAEAPPLARVLGVERVDGEPDASLREFSIVASEDREGARTIVPPDSATCQDCLRELADPTDRRYRHPFITCTNCGPRFTIIRTLPYDRPGTTLADLPMCPACAAEYREPRDRRFHAQPISCLDCGPRLWFAAAPTAGRVTADTDTRPASSTVRARTGDDACLAAAVDVLRAGRVLAVKGIGGYHLACSALDDGAVRRLRERKAREAKPLAVMVADLATARAICHVNPAEAEALSSPARPIVLLRRRAAGDLPVAAAVAPGNAELGVMLAYAPVHHLLFADGAPPVLVMTSGNVSGEPICFDDGDATRRLGPIADATLGHDRPIAVPCDDSVVRVIGTEIHPLRRSRGYAPLPVLLGAAAAQPTVLAVGGELKATACLLAGDRAYLSQHLGDMESLAGQSALGAAATHLAALYAAPPTAWACDLHPDYHSRRWAERNHGDLPLIPVQHHHAHAVSLLAEHGRLGTPTLVCAFDGTGYGTDGAIWGGEALLLGADVGRFDRVGRLREVALPGGDAAVAAPWRIALAHLAAAGLAWDDDLPCVQAAGDAVDRFRQLLGSRMSTTPATSMGRLFDAVASLLGVCQSQGFEAQAAIELEQAARAAGPAAPALPVVVGPDGAIDPGPLLAALIARRRAGDDVGRCARAFHDWVVACVLTWAHRARRAHGVDAVGLTGGVFANTLLATGCTVELERAGFSVLAHHLVPAGDGGIALGQAVIAAARLREDDGRPTKENR